MPREERLAVLTDIVSPYRVPVFRELQKLVDLRVILLADRDQNRGWDPYVDDGTFPLEVLPALPYTQRFTVGTRPVHLVRGVRQVLRRVDPAVVVVGGWNQPAFWDALRPPRPWRAAIWVESNLRDQRVDSRARDYAKRQALRWSDGAVVPGKASTEYVRALCPDKRIFVAPNAVDVDAIRRWSTTDVGGELRSRLGVRSIIAFVGDVSFAKGIDVALDTVHQLGPDVGLAVLGSGPERARWEGHAQSIGLDGRVVFEGFVKGPRVAAVLGSADVLLFPTRSDPWGLVINEAQAAGCPVLASPHAGAVHDLLGDGGGLVVELDPSLWADAVRKVLLDRSRRDALVAAGAKAVEAHSPAACALGLASTLELA